MAALKGSADLLVAIALAWLLVPLAAFTAGPPRIAVALASVFFLPGYGLLAWLFPRGQDLSPLDRVALSIAMSLALVPLTSLALNVTPWGLWPASVVVGLSCVTSSLLGLALYRRWQLSELAGPQEHEPQSLVKAGKLLVLRGRAALGPSNVLLGATGLVLIGAVLFVTIVPKTVDTFTEFYVLGPDGKLTDYPERLSPGAPARLVLGFANREGKRMSYHAVVLVNGAEVERIGPIELAAEQRWERPLELRSSVPPGRSQAAFLLYTDGGAEPYRSLHLWLDVRQPP